MPRSPLHQHHEALGARFVDFAGWDMPVQYEGVIAEHMAVRRASGVFDVSHLGRFAVRGEGATDLLRSQLCNDAAAVDPGRAQYTMALDESGGVVDDIIVWRLDDEHYWVLPNGANYDTVVARFSAAALASTEIHRLQETTALLAVQGPDAPGLVTAVLGSTPGRFRVVEKELDGTPVWAAGTGYTGEPGAEIAVAAEHGGELFARFVDAGAAPCGLGARDTLRLEMGYPLWGQDLDQGTTPLEAGLEWVVAWDHDFVGRRALEAQQRDGVAKRLVGFAMEDRQIARHDYPLRSGGAAGAVTSGNYSPVLERGIGMGYLAPPDLVEGEDVEVEIRGRWVPARRVDPPFVRVA